MPTQSASLALAVAETTTTLSQVAVVIAETITLGPDLNVTVQGTETTGASLDVSVTGPMVRVGLGVAVAETVDLTPEVNVVVAELVTLTPALEVVVTNQPGVALEPRPRYDLPVAQVDDLATLPDRGTSGTDLEAAGVEPGDVLVIEAGPNRGHYIVTQVATRTIWVRAPFPYQRVDPALLYRARTDLAVQPVWLTINQAGPGPSPRVHTSLEVLVN